ncbi:MAG: histone deacetylase [Blastocatellia bacterium]|nr:histone deacetylase [Blastocatellia bacterium]
MRLSYTPRYWCDIGEGHRFPMSKYERVRDRLVGEGSVLPDDLVEPEPATDDLLRLVHTDDYLERLSAGQLSDREIRRLGFPWSRALVQRARCAVAGTLAAARCALETGASANLAGGTHHAFPDHGEAFCTLNDMAVTIRVLRRERRVRRVAIVDCDVHQGNANAEIFDGDEDTLTFSMHGAGNYPLFKKTSDIDIELQKGAGDGEFMAALDSVVPGMLDRFKPDLVLYQAGVDPHEDDRLGTLALTIDGLAARDRFVFDACRHVGVPVVSTMGGGYGRRLETTIEAHCNTIRVLKDVFEG